MQDDIGEDRQEHDARLALVFIFFRIACVAIMGVVLTACVYWGFQ